MSKFFTIIKDKVKYPTWCPHGFMLKEIDGNREYPVDKFLGESLLNKISQVVEENIDFEVIQRDMNRAILCNKGEVAGGDSKSDGCYYTMIEEDKNGKQKRYHSRELTPIQFAEKVKSEEYLEDVKW